MDDLFYEIEYDSQPLPGIEPIPGVGRFVLKPRSESVQKDARKGENGSSDVRSVFHKMRELARFPARPMYDSSDYYGALDYFATTGQSRYAEVFYKQGMFMKDFTDDYTGGSKDFSEYYPSYQTMGFEQLRTYFTWRTAVRNGDIRNTCVSYAFVYIYELLNNIGVNDPSDALDRLVTFWTAFREYGKTFDKYMLKWFKDYHDYYDLPRGFEEFTALNQLQSYYPENFLYDCDDLEAWNKISSYNIEKSKFYNDNNESLMKEAYKYVMSKLKMQIQFKELIFESINFEHDPFNGAIFINRLSKPIQMKRLFVTKAGKQLTGYIIKKIESCVRQQVRYKYKIKTTPYGELLNSLSWRNGNGSLKDKATNAVKLIKAIEQNIEQYVKEYYIELNRTVVEVDFGNLARIREEAQGTQEKLIVDEIPQEILREEAIISSATNESINPNPNTFTELETKALSALLRGENIAQFAAKNNIMPEVLIDGINEKAVDLIGDNFIDEEYNLYEDYKEKVKELL